MGGHRDRQGHPSRTSLHIHIRNVMPLPRFYTGSPSLICL
ncbi:protein of unknown function [Streptomyces murinus]